MGTVSRVVHAWSLSLFAVLLVAGCPDSTTREDGGAVDSGVDGGPPRDGGPTEIDGGPPRPDGCVATTEACDGADDDCDGLVDEGSADDLGCGAAECVDGACVCPAARTCGGECVDTASDPMNCGSCGNTCADDSVCVGGACVCPTDPVDLLFMVDSSNSMTEEQESLAEAFPRMIRVLTTGDLDDDGTPERPIVNNLHVGVITADMGTGGFRVPTCSEPDFGEDGILRTRGNTSIAGCAATYPRFLSFAPGGSTTAFATDFECVARTGTGGCGFEQQLEAVLKALTPSTSPIRFVMDTTGHGDGANAGFLRADSVLAVVVVTDEEDCSARDPALFDPMSSTYAGDLNLRCFNYPSAVHPVSRFVDGLLALRARPEDLIFAQITGIPLDALPAPGAAVDYAAILSHPDMIERIDPAMPARLATSCNVAGRGFAFPPRRIVATARELEARGAATVLSSICQADYSAAMLAIADRVGVAVGTTCD